jgi:cytochrome c oxidase cbb3-type subunit 3
MHIRTILLSSSVLLISLLASGCHREPTPAAAGGTSAANTPVGPIPGGVQDTHYRQNPLEGDPVALQDGRRLFNWYNCSGCHGGHAGGGMGPSLRDRDWLYGDRPDQIYDSIAQGRSKGMPAWGSKIPEQQVWELVAYIKSMRTPQEPDPPVEPANEIVRTPEKNMPLAEGMQTSAAPENEVHK